MILGNYLRAGLLLLLLVLAPLWTACQPASSPPPEEIRLSVALTPQELADFQPALQALEQAHPEWDLTLELVPQSGVIEKLNTQAAAGQLPDVIRIQGLLVQPWIRKSAFLDLTGRIQNSRLPLDDFYPGALDQFRWQDRLYGIPDTAAPDVVFYNKSLFDAAGLPYPTDDWTYEDMHQAAVQLTLDSAGRSPTQPGFDPQQIVQWGWNGGLTFFWQRHLVQAFGADFCANRDCTLMNFTAPETIQAVSWWAALVNQDFAALYDPYGGSQTGVPGDPFISGNAAMGYNGFFAVGQLNEAGSLSYDIVQPFRNSNGQRFTPLSTNGYVISAGSAHPEAAWQLVQALTDPQFLIETWGKPGHSVPARRSAGPSIVQAGKPPVNQAAILKAMEYAAVFKPDTASAFEAYGKTAELFQRIMKGELPVAEGLVEIERLANDTLARDRSQP